jgi:subtilisin family serine protease
LTRIKRGLSIAACLLLLTAAVASAWAGPPQVRLKPATIDTSKAESVERDRAPRAARRYYIVQSKERVGKPFAQALRARGARIISYLPDDAFLVEASPDQLAQVRRLASVRWTGRYRPEYKISPALNEKVKAGAPPEWLTVLVFEGADLKEALAALADEGAVPQEQSAGARFHYLKVRYDARLRLDRIAAIESVAWIEAQRPLRLVEAPTVTGDVPADIMNLEEVWSEGIDGAGQIVGICDTGLDVGILGPPLLDDFEGRVDAAYALGRPGDWSDDHGHGTHVAGTAIGDGSMSAGLFRGAAYGAHLVFQSAYVDENDPIGGIPTNLYPLFEQAYDDGARVHSDSWGSPDHGSYSAYCEQVDEFMWDHKDMLLVFAAGNDGVDANDNGVIDLDSLYSPASAKNCLAVGASENVRSSGGLSDYTWGVLGFLDDLWQAEPLYSDYISDNEDGLAAFSSRGPCDDGRIKPDIVAPGTDIISCRTQDPVGYSLAEYNTWGVYDDYYVYLGGTSMAAPAAAGSAALTRQFLIERAGLSNPSAAVVKAALINGAYDMTPGQYGSGAAREMGVRPNNAEGWGRVDLHASLFSSSDRDIAFVDDQTGLSTAESQEYEIIVGDPGVPLRATLAYTDYPGNPAAAVQLVNDLDLVVIDAAGLTRYPNRLTEADRLNNVETVDIASPEAGLYRVRVSGYNVPLGPQPYALVVSYGKKSGIGHVVLNKAAYGQADTTATVTVIDEDIAGAGVQAATVYSTTDPAGEILTLVETSAGSAVFTGQVGLTVSTPGSGEIRIAHGDVITALYHDADHGGSPADVTDTATVDLIFPVISSVGVVAIGADHASIAWTTSEQCNALVRYGTAPLQWSVATSPEPATWRTVELEGLQPNTRYYFAVSSADAAGNTTEDDNGGGYYTFATGYGTVSFADDMEMGPNGWTHSGTFDQWEHGTPTYSGGPSSAHSPVNCWGTVLDGSFMHDDFFSGSWVYEDLVSPTIAVGQAATLSFWHWYDLVESNDEMTVEISVAGGPWQNITPGYLYEGVSGGWVQESIDLSPYGNANVRIKFEIWADTWFDFLDPHAGWYVDDVEIASFHSFGAGTVALDRRAYGLSTPVRVTVIDGDENADPDVAETLAVVLLSDSEPAGETLILSETAPNSGIFAAAMSLSTSVVHGDGLLGVADDDTITAHYVDLDDGAGHYNVLRVATARVELQGPSLTDLNVSGVSSEGALVEFTSGPNVTATVAYGTAGSYDMQLTATSADGHFAFVLSGLQDNLLYHFRITLEDEAGNVVVHDGPPEDFRFGTKATRTYALNRFDGDTSRLAFSSDNSVWELGPPEFGPPAAFSEPNCWGTDLDGPYPINCDVSLTSDWITLMPESRLSFQHWYSINEYMLEDAYGLVEISTNGTTWQDVTPSSGGYVGNSGDDWTPETIDLSAYGSAPVKLRFRLYSQESDIVLYYYAGWYVDDVSLTQMIEYGRGSLFFDRDVYSLSTPVQITLIDAHLNADPATAETVLLPVSSTLETLDVLFTETAPNSGKFVATVTLDDSAPAPDGLLQVSTTDTITVEYDDADDGSGSPAFVTAHADVDLLPPQITNLVFAEASDRTFAVGWSTSEPCLGRVHWGETAAAPLAAGPSVYTTAHSMTVAGLDENTGYFVKISATDEAGNQVVDDNMGGSYRVYTKVRKALFRDDFDRDEKGWTHSGVADEWERGTPSYGIANAASPPNCWATDLDSTYEGTVDASLVSPSVALEPGARVMFKHWYNIEEFGLDDGMGYVEVSTNGTAWTNISTGGGYTGKAKAGWHDEDLSLEALGASTVNVRFRLTANQTIEYWYPGWYIDDFSVYVLKPYGYGVLLLDRQVYTVVDQVEITLKDGHLNADPETVETALVDVMSTSDPVPRPVMLVETDAASGIFVGVVALSQFAGSDALRVADGDLIVAQYFDADNAEGGHDVPVSAQATVSILDTDGDGMPDAWEAAHGLDPQSGIGDDGAAGDPDGDGSPNHDEMVADTDPRDAASLFAIIELRPTAEGMVVKWRSRPHKVYRVHWSPDYVAWTPVAGTVSSAGDETEWLDTPPPEVYRRFYKVEVVQ